MSTPAPGIYPNVAPEEYHAWDAISNSRLTQLLRSPAHLRAYIEEPREPTEALIIGSAADVMTLTPDRFEDLYTSAGQCEAIKKGDGQRCTSSGSLYLDGKWYCGTKSHAPEGAGPSERTILTPAQYSKCLRIAASVRAHPRIGRLLGAPGRAQLAVVWTDEATGLLCKGLIDWFSDQFGVVLDLKTTRDARRFAFEKSIADFGYHRQLAFYEDGLKANGVTMKHLVFAAVEKEPPFAVAGYRLSTGAADEGRTELRHLLQQYAALRETPMDEWPAYDTDITEIALPAWAYGRIQEAA
jgi:hypothetical protein